MLNRFANRPASIEGQSNRSYQSSLTFGPSAPIRLPFALAGAIAAIATVGVTTLATAQSEPARVPQGNPFQEVLGIALMAAIVAGLLWFVAAAVGAVWATVRAIVPEEKPPAPPPAPSVPSEPATTPKKRNGIVLGFRID